MGPHLGPRSASAGIEVCGTCHPRFGPVRDAFAQALADGRELGASLYVNVDGEEVVDLWGGWRDRDRSVPWSEETIVNVFSATKTVTSLAILMLADRGVIDIEAPVAAYWPEFAANGKTDVRVRHLLSHTAGLPAWEPPFRLDDALDIEASTARLAAQAPWWRPGARGSYHASTFGHLNAELLRRVTGRTLPEFIEGEIAGPLDADFRLGLGAEEFGRVATVYPPEAPEGAPSPGGTGRGTRPATEEEVISRRTRAGSFAGTMGDPLTVFNSPEWRRSGFGGSGGHANARGLGRIMSVLSLGGTARGQRLLSPRTIDTIFREQAKGVDAYYMKPIRWGIGYALAPEAGDAPGPLPFIRPGPGTCFWYGHGGALALADTERRLAIGYAMNRLQSGRSSLNGLYHDAIHDCLRGEAA